MSLQINKQYVKDTFKQQKVQLSKEALEDIVRHLQVTVNIMASRCSKGHVKRLTPDLMFIALGKLGG